MDVKEIAIDSVEVSEFNTRKNLADGQDDSTIEDLAQSIEKQGLLNPITVFVKPNGRYALIAGQRRLLAYKHLQRPTIPAIVRETMTEAEATAISLVENVHRADMNPRDKAIALKTLADIFGDLRNVSRATGVSVATIRRYLQLLCLTPELQEKLAAGEVKSIQALAHLAQQVTDPDAQVRVWNKIGGFTQDVQQEIIKRLEPDIDNLDALVDEAAEGEFGYHVVRNCPFDCPAIPKPLKQKVASMIEEFAS